MEAETAEELALVQTILDSRWRLRRILARETALTILTTQQNRYICEDMFGRNRANSAAFIDSLGEAAGFQANLRAFAQLQRFEAKLMKVAATATEELREMVFARLQDSAPEPTSEEHAPEMAAAAGASAATGFVPSQVPQAASPANMPRFSGPHKKQHRRNWLRQHGRKDVAAAA